MIYFLAALFAIVIGTALAVALIRGALRDDHAKLRGERMDA